MTNTDYAQGYTFTDNYQMVIDFSQFAGSITNPQNLRLYYYNTSTLAWTQIDIGVDLEQQTIFATLDHFTDFLLSEAQENYGNATIIIQSGGVPHLVDSLVTFETKALTGSIQESTATLAAPWTAVDPSGSGEGWHVEMTAEDFVSGSHSITIDNTKVKQADVNITMVYGNEPPVSAQTTFTSLDPVTPVKLLSAAPHTGMGTYQFTPEFTLTIPASAYAGTYVAPVQLTIITAP